MCQEHHAFSRKSKHVIEAKGECEIHNVKAHERDPNNEKKTQPSNYRMNYEKFANEHANNEHIIMK